MKLQRKRINKTTGLPVRDTRDTMKIYLELGYSKYQAFKKIKMAQCRSEARLQFGM
jgi:hypothetical protein